MKLESDSLDKLLPDLVAMQGELPNVAKDATNPHFKSKYADLASVIDVARPLLKNHNFALTHQTAIEEGKPILITTLWHKSGQFLRCASSIAPEKPTFQGVGSAMTYTRRYDGMAIIGMAPDEDDDGNAAGARRQQNASASKHNGQPSGTDWDGRMKRAIAAVQRVGDDEGGLTLDDWWKGFRANLGAAPAQWHDPPLRSLSDRLNALQSNGKLSPEECSAALVVAKEAIREPTDTEVQAEERF